jgi:hypothetical protein
VSFEEVFMLISFVLPQTVCSILIPASAFEADVDMSAIS